MKFHPGKCPVIHTFTFFVNALRFEKVSITTATGTSVCKTNCFWFFCSLELLRWFFDDFFDALAAVGALFLKKGRWRSSHRCFVTGRWQELWVGGKTSTKPMVFWQFYLLVMVLFFLRLLLLLLLQFLFLIWSFCRLEWIFVLNLVIL